MEEQNKQSEQETSGAEPKERGDTDKKFHYHASCRCVSFVYRI